MTKIVPTEILTTSTASLSEQVQKELDSKDKEIDMEKILNENTRGEDRKRDTGHNN